MPFFSSIPPFIWSANDQGIAVRFSDLRRYKKAQKGHAGTVDQLAFIRMHADRLKSVKSKAEFSSPPRTR
ncbi:MAG: hypothetical protein BWK80_62665 [Desulfobacteraceae bacterium IS3]|nr:MAG: hypothetical protein BWK80_62665 [Desulfobacteraceae bacterium IS3]